MIDIATLEARIRELNTAREDFLAQANSKSGEFTGRIAECERLLAELKREQVAPPMTTPYSDPENVNLDFTRTGHGANSG